MRLNHASNFPHHEIYTLSSLYSKHFAIQLWFPSGCRLFCISPDFLVDDSPMEIVSEQNVTESDLSSWRNQFWKIPVLSHQPNLEKWKLNREELRRIKIILFLRQQWRSVQIKSRLDFSTRWDGGRGTVSILGVSSYWFTVGGNPHFPRLLSSPRAAATGRMWVLANTAKSSGHILVILWKYVYKRSQRKRSYFILLETIENFIHIGTLLVEKALKKWGHICTCKEKWKIETIIQSFQSKRNILAIIRLPTEANACFLFLSLSLSSFFFPNFLSPLSGMTDYDNCWRLLCHQTGPKTNINFLTFPFLLAPEFGGSGGEGGGSGGEGGRSGQQALGSPLLPGHCWKLWAKETRETRAQGPVRRLRWWLWEAELWAQTLQLILSYWAKALLSGSPCLHPAKGTWPAAWVWLVNQKMT